MSLSQPSQPSLPNPSNVATTQQTLNTQAGEASQAGSMVSQYNPWGSTSYTQTGTGPNGTPIYSATTALSPQQEELYNMYTALQGQGGVAGNELMAGANYGSVSPATALGNETEGLTGTAMGQEEAYMQPYFNYQTQQQETQLANQGFDPTSPAWQQAMLNLSNQQNNTMTGFEAQIEPQMYSQAQQNYLLPEELALSMGGFSAPTSPTQNEVSTPGLTIQPANYEGDVATQEQAALQEYQNQMQLYGATLGGIGSLAGTLGGDAMIGYGMSQMPAAAMLLPVCDERLKENIEHLGTLPNGVHYWAFNFKGDHPSNRHIGLIAQDVETKRPHAVHHDEYGIKHVDYDAAMR